jgi:glycosyltransferase involved in cell wall biosynthesis
MKIWLVADNIDESSGGPPRSIAGLAEGLSMIDGVEVTVIASASKRPIEISSIRCVKQIFLKDQSRLSKFLGISYIKFLFGVRPDCRPDIVHMNSLWPQTLFWYFIFSIAYGIPIVLSPRGTLSDWALGHKAWKKNLGMTFYRLFLFRTVKLFVASSAFERSDIVKNIQSPNVVIVPNPVIIDTAQVNKLRKNREKSAVNVLLFLGRINPIKRVDHLVACFIKANPKDWKLVIAGPDEQGNINSIMNAVTESDMLSKIVYVGSVAENSLEKLALFANADVVVLPSHSENFGIVIAESLACGIPVVATKGTPWESIITYNCGWYIDTTQEALVSTINEITSKKRAELALIGKRGERAVYEFQSYTVAKVMAENYENILKI